MPLKSHFSDVCVFLFFLFPRLGIFCPVYLNLRIMVLEVVQRLEPGAECCRTMSSAEFKDTDLDRKEGLYLNLFLHSAVWFLTACNN